MELLKVTKNILNKMSLYDFETTIKLVTYSKYLLIVVFLSLTFITSFYYVTLHIDNISKASTALFAANIMFISIIYFTMLFMQKNELRLLIADVVNMAIDRKYLVLKLFLSFFIIEICKFN